MESKMNKKLTENPEIMEGFDCVYQFEIDHEIWSLDLLSTTQPQIVPQKHSSPDCIIRTNTENFEKLVKGKLNAPLALITGKLKIGGEKALALKLAKLFS